MSSALATISVVDWNERLREVRKRLRLSQNEVAQKALMTREAIASYETGRRPFPPNLEPLVEELEAEVFGRPRIPVTYEPQPMRYAGMVPAGNWGDPLASEDFVDVDPGIWHNERYVATVAGMSLYPALHPGDMTMWHQDMNPQVGLIVLAQRKGDHFCTAKVLEWRDGRHHLMPLNPDHEEADDPEGWGAIARLVCVERTVEGLKRRWFTPEGLRPKHLT